MGVVSGDHDQFPTHCHAFGDQRFVGNFKADPHSKGYDPPVGKFHLHESRVIDGCHIHADLRRRGGQEL